ncbi:MAG: lipoyl(octanoyl) transferase LipB [Spirochaetia bacterium]|nr:lipoyl(octanoyl) transferase LipB [Spirochaetia bacterium]
MHFISKYCNLVSYSNALKLMEEKITDAVQQKICFVFGLEHETIYTSGLKTLPEHIIGDIVYVKSRRGGSITVHNPGQLVLYTVLPLASIGGNLEKYIRVLEKAIIKTLSVYGIKSFQNNEHTGVWTDKGKIAFIGIGAKKGAVYHGAAINVNNNLDAYIPIRSCGLDLPITRMKNEIHPEKYALVLQEIFQEWLDHFIFFFQKDFQNILIQTLTRS